MKKIKKFISDHFEGLIIILVFMGVLGIAFLIHYKFEFLNFLSLSTINLSFLTFFSFPSFFQDIFSGRGKPF
jgi:hypothetical protein